ncbi:MarR family transcriptional regulator [Streptomyces sp. ME19-01-6]|uniref:MarR family winged helix-turn-helix transcriptional regulator n=1 Tax=Streptomyces sp. ME19-01-6 TaxID=3028686 RepID=UPI0029BA7801|nr:MarR family transcriptional regulator [Streptomyces sp. ME19-01-6]MDX3231539.1 MarR family transcriptional regulator [Streptomyces sp. ME19-01-6]
MEEQGVKPIGYWLKYLDGLLEVEFERVLSDSGLVRRHWQALNSLSTGPKALDELTAALRPFWGAAAITLDEVLDGLERRGWLAREGADGPYALTPLGTEGHAAVAERVGATRRRVTGGVTDEEYLATVDVLRRMAENLGGVAGAAPAA